MPNSVRTHILRSQADWSVRPVKMPVTYCDQIGEFFSVADGDEQNATCDACKERFNCEDCKRRRDAGYVGGARYCIKHCH